MQSIKVEIDVLTGHGWETATHNMTVNEQIGLDAGRDVYATARGTAIALWRRYGICYGGHCMVTVDGLRISMVVQPDGVIAKSLPTPIGQYPEPIYEAAQK